MISFTLPSILILLALISLVLHIVFAYLIGDKTRALIASLIILLILVLWFLLPLRSSANAARSSTDSIVHAAGGSYLLE